MPLTIPTLSRVGSAANPWTFQLATHAGVNIGDITGARERKLTFALNRPTTYEFTLDLQHAYADDLISYYTSVTNQPGLIVKGYKFGLLKSVTEIVTAEIAGDNETHGIKCVAADAASLRIAQRLVGKSSAGVKFTSQERGSCVSQMLTTINTEFDTKVKMGTIQPSSTVTAGPFYYKPFLETVQELGAAINGYDHWVAPADPTEDAYGVLGYLNVAPIRGAMRDNAVFEYGTARANVADYKVQLDGSQRATIVYSVPAGYPNSNGLAVRASSVDTSALAAVIGHREYVIDTELVDTNMRDTLINEHVTVRRFPRQVYTFNPHVNDGTGRVPDVLMDYDVGDMLRGRVNDQNLLLLDGVVRVYKAEISLDDTGVEEVKLTTVDEG
jgi:hypothetical protein